MTLHPISVALVGASGYGLELTRHSTTRVRLEFMCAGRSAGEPADSVIKGLGLPPLVAFDADQIAASCTYAFLGLPHKTAQDVTHELLERGVKVVDLGADHRFDDPDFYGAVYEPHRHPENCDKTVYGCPELHREAIEVLTLLARPAVINQCHLGCSASITWRLLAEPHAIADCKVVSVVRVKHKVWHALSVRRWSACL